MTIDTPASVLDQEAVQAPAKPAKPRKASVPSVASSALSIINDGDEMLITDSKQLQAFEEVFGAKYLKGFQDPVIFEDASFYSSPVQQAYKRDFALISRVSFGEYIYRRRPAFNTAVLDYFSDLCNKKLENITELLTRETQRIHVLMKQNGMPVNAAYPHKKDRVVPIIHSSALRYLRVLKLFDRLLQATGSAVIYGVFTPDQRKEAELRCRRAVLAFSTMVRQESTKLSKESRRLQQVEGSTDESTQQADAMLAEGIAQFDLDIKGSADGGAPAAALDDALATSRAVAAADAPIE
ncbi:hypothetical protein LJR189_004689 [Acidovorax delafieldii]|jgi:hypothetical protein|uniref:hypothetical protein n=1 Tax=Acidovorax delafieldii TaxID=47920 RepID=UPI003ED0830E